MEQWNSAFFYERFFCIALKVTWKTADWHLLFVCLSVWFILQEEHKVWIQLAFYIVASHIYAYFLSFWHTVVTLNTHFSPSRCLTICLQVFSLDIFVMFFSVAIFFVSEVHPDSLPVVSQHNTVGVVCASWLQQNWHDTLLTHGYGLSPSFPLLFFFWISLW